MPKFDVYMTRLVTEYTTVTVEAPDAEAAASAALECADTADWETDFCACNPPPEVSGVDAQGDR
jgi:hypothetical protein